MPTAITIGGHGPFVFSAAHTGLHDGEFEPLHGHTFTVTLHLRGEPASSGMLADFRLVKKTLAGLIAPLHGRTLMAARLPGGRCRTQDGQMLIECGAKHYSLPAQDVLLLPVVNTTTEAIAGYLLGQVLPSVTGQPGLTWAELTLAEAADSAATVSAGLGSTR
jgi:6-pyruvoyltetrahydropterin/6-carboxytetrahydropterin synthase